MCIQLKKNPHDKVHHGNRIVEYANVAQKGIWLRRFLQSNLITHHYPIMCEWEMLALFLVKGPYEVGPTKSIAI